MEYEVRTAEMWPDADFEMRAESDGLTLEGYAAVFNVPSHPMSFSNIEGGRVFREIIRPGAFTKSLAEAPDITLRYQHDMTQLPLARTKSGTLELNQDDRGLRVAARLPDNEWGRPVRDAIQRGDITGMSFRFANPTVKWEQTESGYERHLLDVPLRREVSVTDIPAYPDTTAIVRHLAEAADVEPDELAEAFRALRDADVDFTEAQAKLINDVLAARLGHRYVHPNIVEKYARLGRAS